MLSLRSIICCILLSAGVWQSAHSWTGQIVGDLPGPVIDDILSILVYGTVQVTGNCSTSNDTSEVQYWLYTRNNPSDAIIINSFSQIDPTKQVIFLIHGWGGNADIDYIHAIKEAYLQRYDCNIISINWPTYATAMYQSSYCHLPSIGAAVGKFICNMSSTLNINLSDLHVVGHSLGAQMAGFIGQYVHNACDLLGRITALDPAGPLYQGVSTNDRLDEKDAQFVDVIHTNQGQFGYIGDCGSVDFYPNCGYLQPGCVVLLLNETSTVQDIITLPLTYINCNHQRSCYLFAESINCNSFYSTSCLMCGTPICTKKIIGATNSFMGESCRSQPADPEYTLQTNGQSPYARGPQGPLN